MMELREPPRPPASVGPERAVRALLFMILAAVLGVGALLVLRPAPGDRDAGGESERDRRLAAKLQAAGALEEAAVRYERYLERADLEPEARAGIAYSLGSSYLEQGDLQRALRWFYEAELWGAGELEQELGRKIVHTLERLGRFHAAQSALDSRVRLDGEAEVVRGPGDPVVARIGAEPIYRSQVERALDELPPELAQRIRTPEDRREYVRQYVAEKLLWRKAQKLEYDRDPEVARRHAAALEQLAVARLIEDEVVGTIEVDEADLRNFFVANKERYRQEDAEAEPVLDQVRPLVERDYRLSKLQSGYQALIDEQLAAEEVELFLEAMEEGR